MIQVSAPAKTILFGEHAVVYGQPAIAVPVHGLKAHAAIQAAEHHLRIVARDLNNRVIEFDGRDPLAEAARLTISKLDISPPEAIINIHSDIPIASGLGSGAAISTVLVKSIAQFCGKQLDDAETNDIVYEVEKLHHGTPSGIDNTVIVYEQSIYFVRGKPIERVENTTPLRLLITNTGISAPTKVAVGDVRTLYETQHETTKPVIEAIGNLVDDARQAMRDGDLDAMGKLMTQNHEYLKQLTVSSALLDKLVIAANDAGALGAKLSGGGRGGNMIALVTNETEQAVSQALKDAGGVSVFGTTIEATSA